MKSSPAREKSIGYYFSMIHRSHSALAKDGMLALGVTLAQLPFLAQLLIRYDPVSQDELSRILSIDPGATARNLEQLEKKGLVSREVNPENRRQKLVVATSRAREIEEDFFSVLRTASERLVEGLSADEKEMAVMLLERILANGMRARYENG